MHPLFRPTTADHLIVAKAAPDPGAAFLGWLDKPSQTIVEAERYVELAAKINEKRKELWESRDKDSQKTRDVAAELASKGIPHSQGLAAAIGNLSDTLPIRPPGNRLRNQQPCSNLRGPLLLHPAWGRQYASR